MDEYLAFVDFIGKTITGDYIYRFDFTSDTETVWGEFFNVAPSALIPDLQPDKNCITKNAKAVFPTELVIAKKNYCFSMQDCIDGIIPLCFCEINDNTLTIDNIPFFLRFGEPFENVNEKLNKFNIKFYEITECDNGDYSAIDDLINDFEEF